MDDIPLSQTQGLVEGSPATQSTPLTPYATPQANAPRGPPAIQRGQNPEPIYPSDALIRLVEDKLKPKFNETFVLIREAMKLTKTPADGRFLTPILKQIQTNIAGFVVTGGKRKTKKRSKFRSRS